MGISGTLTAKLLADTADASYGCRHPWLARCCAQKKEWSSKGFHSILRVVIHKSVPVPGSYSHTAETKKCQKTAMLIHGILWHYLQS